MKNELMNSMGNQVLNVAMSGMKWFADKGIRATQSIPDAVGNVMKITAFKNHNIDIHIFMNKK